MHGRPCIACARRVELTCNAACAGARLSTIFRSDHIVVLHKGEIVEQGTHDFLTSHQAPFGKYRAMWEQQSLLATANDTE